VWSGDIPATWDSLRDQVKVGLSMAVSGIPWWTTDIGGFFGGNPKDPAYRELFTRWMQYGALCPLFRIHGIRDPRSAPEVGGPPEVWAFGKRLLPVLTAVIKQREAMRPYLERLSREARDTGIPPMRPLVLDWWDDPAGWEVADQFMLGPDLLVAPVTEPGVTQREVYLPGGAQWRSVTSDAVFDGGVRRTFSSPMEHIPVLARVGAPDPFGGGWVSPFDCGVTQRT
jgi:alpha-D-xyloside xylohydrolase